MNILAFPGQGSQKIGMGKLFCENFSTAKNVFEEVDDTLKFKLSKSKNDYSERKRVIEFLFKHNYFGSNYENLNKCFHINLSKL